MRTRARRFRPFITIFRLVSDLEWQMPTYLFVEMVEQAQTVKKARIWCPDPKYAGKSVFTKRARARCFRPVITIFWLIPDLEW